MTYQANRRKRNAPQVSGESPWGARLVAQPELLREPANCRVLRNSTQPLGLICRPRLRDPFSKSRCVRRELYPKGASYRPTGSRGLRDNCGQTIAPDPTCRSDGPKHDPLLVGRQRKAGEAIGSRYEQGSYTELKSVASTPHPSQAREGRHSGTRTYGRTR